MKYIKEMLCQITVISGAIKAGTFLVKNDYCFNFAMFFVCSEIF